MPRAHPTKSKQLTNNARFFSGRLLVFVVAFILVGGLVLWRALAAEPVVAVLQAEQMSLPAGAKATSDVGASGSSSVKFAGSGNLTGKVNLPSPTDSVTLTAKGSKCNGNWPYFNLAIDGANVLTKPVKSSDYANYGLTKKVPSGSHNLTITVVNIGQANCSTIIDLDAITFYGPNDTTY